MWGDKEREVRKGKETGRLGGGASRQQGREEAQGPCWEKQVWGRTQPLGAQSRGGGGC